MTLIAVILSAVLVLLAAVHLLWAFGIWFPIREEEVLVRSVVGLRGATRMPGPIPCALLVVALLVAALLPWLPAGGLRDAGLWGAALVFAGRGLAGYLPLWRRLTPQQPFDRLNRRYYSPLSLALGAGFLALVLNGA